ncbi:MAG: PIN domain nuclease [Anaerolineae bacterium]|nr:PIN domain nuclease [Anaerolineae bacterium]
MSTEFILRILLMIVFAFFGTQFGVWVSSFLEFEGGYIQVTILVFMFFGALAGLILAPWLTTRPARTARLWIGKRPSQTLLASLMGLFCGLAMAALFTVPLSQMPAPFNQFGPIVSAVIICYINLLIFSSRAEDIFRLLKLKRVELESAWFGENARGSNRRILLDTSVIIDGRIADISKLGFVGGTLVVPRFILAELQHIADSSDTLRRNRGRRGLEVLNEMQQDEDSLIEIIDDDIESVREADEKLVLLARKYSAPVMTNDFNLNRVAELQGVTVLNINELANAVKAVYLPGENMTIRVLQEGKEINQGVGYLDDGTMVVIEEGKRYIDRTIEVEVTKHIQTPAGRMIFARPLDMIPGPGRSR